MSYVGNSPAEIYSSVQKQTITGDGTVGPYTLDYPASTNDVSVFVNNVRQEPTVAYTVSGTSMTMTGAVASTDNFYVVFSGLTQGTIVPPDGSVTAAKLAPGAVQAFVSGMLLPYAGTSAPTGWLFAYGQAVSRTTYADLFTAVGTTYGSGDGSTTFNLPDLRGRVVAGQDDMGGTSANRLTDQSGGLDGDVLGDTGGSETHTLVTSEMPSHNHTFSGPISATSGGGSYGATSGYSGTASTIGNTGGDGAHNNVQPTIILNYIIKT